MLRPTFGLSVWLAVGLSTAVAFGQANRSTASTARTSVNGMGGAGIGSGSTSRMRGMQQSGQLTSDAAISRDASAFVGDSAGSFLSRSGQTGSRIGTGGLLGSSGLGGAYGMSSRGMGYGGTGSYGRGGSSRYGMGNQSYNQTSRTGRNSTTTQIRTQLRIGFELSRPAATEVTGRLLNRIPRIPGLELVNGVAVKMDGRTAVLQGVVASQNQRDLLARLALLEPGISDVRNELVVSPSPGTSPASLPAPEVVPARSR